MLGIGLCGAHRSGKTTLARDFSVGSGMPYVTLSASEVIASLGLSFMEIKTLDQRLAVQQALVDKCEAVFRDQREPFVSDRTPMDIAAYLMAEAMKDGATPAQQAKIMELLKRCWDIGNETVGVYFLVPPDLPYVAEPGKPDENKPYQEHIHLLIYGLLADERNHRGYWYLRRGAHELDRRVGAVAECWTAYTNRLREIYAGQTIQ